MLNLKKEALIIVREQAMDNAVKTYSRATAESDVWITLITYMDKVIGHNVATTK